ncbi:redox-regulated ATPase YchF [Candidatus Bathyarchaeota archaeon]|nr:redox-regulated ATPase YchF [Candidatus Bathyarchaeota archaeon]
MLIGLVGKPSAGKSTFLNAATMAGAKTGDYPFTTIKANPGKGFVRRPCVSREFDVEPDPNNSLVKSGIRFCPVDLLDVAGLVPGAHEGKGMGNQFLNDLSRADVLLHIVDISGSLNEKGEKVDPGSHDPLKDIAFLEREIVYWIKQIIEREDWARFIRTQKQQKTPMARALHERLTGIGITLQHVHQALQKASLLDRQVSDWDDKEKLAFATQLQALSKPIVIVANKIDKDKGKENFERISKMPEYQGRIFPTSALAEYYLRSYAEKGIIEYVPGNGEFAINESAKISSKETAILARMKEEILDVYGSTGVQDALEKAIFDVLDYIFVYPVYDANKLEDHDGRVLPDVFLVKRGTKLIDFVASKIHGDIAEAFIHGINVRTKRRLSEDYPLEADDVVKIVSAK